MSEQAHDAEPAGIANRHVQIAVLTGGWLVLAALSATQLFVRTRSLGGEMSWPVAFLSQLPVWLPWIPLTFVILELARRFPLRRAGLTRSLAFHGGASILAGLVYNALLAPIVILEEGLAIDPATLRVAIVGNTFATLHVTFVTYWAIAAAGSALEVQRQLREQEARTERLGAELARAQLGALRSRLQPHFLFNSLHSVASLVRSGDGDGAVRMLTGLGELLRLSLADADRPLVPLHEELESVERYIEIEEVRHGDRLAIVRQIDPATADALVPALLLQPLIENAIRHGVDHVQEDGRVEIHARADGARLVLEVRDNGPGPAPDADDGIGLDTTRRRLQLHYGDRATIALTAAQTGGGSVRVELPLETPATTAGATDAGTVAE